MNWGWKITIVYIGFAAMILTLVYKSTQEKYEMVTTDYYKKEQMHQSKIDGANRVKQENQFVVATVLPNGVQLVFPAESSSAKKLIEIYCPTDEKKDKTISTNDGAINVALSPAKYRIKTSWSIQEKSYYQEKEVWVK